MHRRAVRLSPRHRTWVYASFGVLWLTGMVWLFARYFLRRETEFGEVPGPLEPWSLKIHGAAAMISLMVIGSLIPLHLRRGWRLKVNTGTGVVLVSTVALLLVSGFGLYYFGSPLWRTFASWTHVVVGTGLPLVLAVHILIGVRQATRDHPPGPSTNRTGSGPGRRDGVD